MGRPGRRGLARFSVLWKSATEPERSGSNRYRGWEEGRRDALEECIAEDDVVYSVQGRVVHDISVDEEEDGQVDFFSCSDFLFFKAETLDFGKIWCNLHMSAERREAPPPLTIQWAMRRPDRGRAEVGAQTQDEGRP